MATQRPQVAGYVDDPIKDRIDKLPMPMSKIVEYCVLKGLPELEKAVSQARGGSLLLTMPSSKPGRPQSNGPKSSRG